MSGERRDPGGLPAGAADESDAGAAPSVPDVFDHRTAELAPLYAAATATLTWGFRLAAVLLAAGLVLAVVRQEPLGREAEPLGDILPAVLDGKAAGLVDVAILWLVATPVAVVLVVAVGFARLGDRRYAALSLLVLAVLGVSIALALTR